ncbi:pyrimidine reductase family protein [Micromonospora aurantiaca (nom. illeg.)]|uniref:pyrimidine reductase family protein n=1 Tax=Micromonospora aurantiaca (nom. illeg.) TaxID=47850 RepID=UPI0033C6E902
MTVGTPIERIWPAPVTGALTDPQLTALYGRTAGPHLRVNFVASADGAVTLDGYSAGLSGEPDKRVFGLLRMLCDGLVVAAGTLRHEGYRAVRLSPERRAWRREQGLAEYPTLVVVSGSLDLDPAQAAFADAPVRPIVLTHADAVPPPGLADVADVIRCGTDTADDAGQADGTGQPGGAGQPDDGAGRVDGSGPTDGTGRIGGAGQSDGSGPTDGSGRTGGAGQVDLVAGLAELRRRGLGQLLCEGGPHLFGALTAADLVDELCLTVAPLLAGAGPGRITAGDASVPRHLPLRHVLAAGDGVLMLRYARDPAETPPAGAAPAA